MKDKKLVAKGKFHSEDGYSLCSSSVPKEEGLVMEEKKLASESVPFSSANLARTYSGSVGFNDDIALSNADIAARGKGAGATLGVGVVALSAAL